MSQIKVTEYHKMYPFVHIGGTYMITPQVSESDACSSVEILLPCIFRLGGVNYGNMHCMNYVHVVCGIYKINIRTLFLHVHSRGRIVKLRAVSLCTESYRCHQVLHKGGVLAR